MEKKIVFLIFLFLIPISMAIQLTPEYLSFSLNPGENKTYNISIYNDESRVVKVNITIISDINCFFNTTSTNKNYTLNGLDVIKETILVIAQTDIIPGNYSCNYSYKYETLDVSVIETSKSSSNDYYGKNVIWNCSNWSFCINSK